MIVGRWFTNHNVDVVVKFTGKEKMRNETIGEYILIGMGIGYEMEVIASSAPPSSLHAKRKEKENVIAIDLFTNNSQIYGCFFPRDLVTSHFINLYT